MEKLYSVLSPDQLTQAGLQSDFIVRQRKLTARNFLDILFSSIGQEVVSLQSLCGELLLSAGIDLSRVGLHKRFGKNSVKFVKGLLVKTLNLQLSLGGLKSKKMKGLCVKDSTRFGLDDRHWKFYAGTNGPRSSSMGIQCEFDLLSGKLLDIDINSGVQNDAKDAQLKIHRIEEGNTYIRDLGYICQKVLDEMEEKKACFLNRLNSNIEVYLDKEGKEIVNFASLYWKMKKEKNPTMELEVYLGTTKTHCRLILDLVPKKVYDKRLREIEKTNKSRGCQTSKKFKRRSRFNLFITNIPQKKLPIGTVIQTYHIRWQVELVFKTWKSLFKIHSDSRMKTHRWETLTYARLLWIVILWDIFIFSRNLLLHTSRKDEMQFLSMFRAMKLVVLNVARIRLWIRAGDKEFSNGFKLFDQAWTKCCRLEHRKGRMKMTHIIQDTL